MRGMWRERWKCKEWDRNVGTKNQCENEGSLGGHGKNVGNQGGDARNQGGKLSISVEMT